MLSALLMIFVVAGVSTLRAILDGQSYLRQGDESMEKGEPQKALRYWRRSARWYVPFASHDDLAFSRMKTLADKAKSEQNTTLELAALRGMRSSIWATRHVTTPHQEMLPEVNKKISVIMAGLENRHQSGNQSLAEKEAWHLKALNKDESPKKSWTLLAAFGFVVWLLSIYGFTQKGFDQEGLLNIKNAMVFSFFFVVGFLVWLLGLWYA